MTSSERHNLINRLRSLRVDIDEAYGVKLFGIVGSMARGDIRPDSDIDVVYLIHDTSNVSLLDLGGVWSVLNEAFDRPVDIIDWNALKPREKRLMQKDLIKFYG